MKRKHETEALVVGAGPVGLFGALSLAERGVGVQIVDKEWRGSSHSYALALHPHSLQMLEDSGVASALTEHGHVVERIVLHDGEERIGVLDIAALGGRFPFLLVVPQSTLERSLEDRLKQSQVQVQWNHEVLSVQETAGEVLARVARMEKHSMGYPIARMEWQVAKETEVRAGFLLGADGYHSSVRRAVGARFEPYETEEAFAVFEFAGEVDSPHEARVVFHGDTTNVVWPLAATRARWSFQVPPGAVPPPTAESLRTLLQARAPWFRHEIGEILWTASVLFERRLVDRFGTARVWLSGDAAHCTGPVGAQSMNIGLREVRDLADRVSSPLQKGADLRPALEGFEQARQAEWRALLGIDRQLRAVPGAESRIAKRAARILSCVPGSGNDLERLLGQISLKLA